MRIALGVAPAAVLVEIPLVGQGQVVGRLVAQDFAAAHRHVERSHAVDERVGTDLAHDRSITLLGEGHVVGIKRQVFEGITAVGTGGDALRLADAHRGTLQRSIAVLGVEHAALDLGSGIFERRIDRRHAFGVEFGRRHGDGSRLVTALAESDDAGADLHAFERIGSVEIGRGRRGTVGTAHRDTAQGVAEVVDDRTRHGSDTVLCVGFRTVVAAAGQSSGRQDRQRQNS